MWGGGGCDPHPPICAPLWGGGRGNASVARSGLATRGTPRRECKVKLPLASPGLGLLRIAPPFPLLQGQGQGPHSTGSDSTPPPHVQRMLCPTNTSVWTVVFFFLRT